MCNSREKRTVSRRDKQTRHVPPVNSIVTFKQTIESYSALKILKKRYGHIQRKGHRTNLSDLIRFALAWTSGVYEDEIETARSALVAEQHRLGGQSGDPPLLETQGTDDTSDGV